MPWVFPEIGGAADEIVGLFRQAFQPANATLGTQVMMIQQ